MISASIDKFNLIWFWFVTGGHLNEFLRVYMRLSLIWSCTWEITYTGRVHGEGLHLSVLALAYLIIWHPIKSPLICSFASASFTNADGDKEEVAGWKDAPYYSTKVSPKVPENFGVWYADYFEPARYINRAAPRKSYVQSRYICFINFSVWSDTFSDID